MGIFSNTKDRLTERAALGYLNSKLLAPYGRATSLRIDSTAKTIQFEAELNGEATPIHIQISDYEITKENGRYFVKAASIHTSREWLTRLAADRVANNRFELPAQVGQLIAATL
jgi:hypothetical protein